MTTTTTHVPIAPGLAPGSPGIRTVLSAGALVAAGVLIDVGHALSINPHGSAAAYVAKLAEHRVAGVLGGLMVAVGAFLLLPGLVAALSLVRGRGAAFATAGGILAGIAAAALGAGDVMNTLVMGALVPEHEDLARELFDVASGDSAPLLGLPFVFAPFLVLGLALVGIGLIRARTVPLWEAVLLIVGAVLVFFSSGGGLVSAALPLLPLAVALVLLGVRAMRA